MHELSLGALDDRHQQGLLGVGLVDSQLEGQDLALDLLPDVGLRGEDAVGVVHVVKLEKLLDEQQQLLPVLLLEQFLALDVLPVEGRYLRHPIPTFF